jgi:prepilin-type N-terminal cleavage/methylation domain-containing protein
MALAEGAGMTRAAGRGQAGFSLIEMMIVVGILGVLIAIALFQIGVSRPGYIGDGGMRVILSQMNQAREMAITKRRNIRVELVGTNQVRISREVVPATVPPTWVVVQSVFMEGSMQYGLLTPALPDSPDTFGNATATEFKLAGTAATELKFTPEGTFINQDGLTLNGSVFLTLPNATKERRLSARVVTVMGSTGRVRAYKWNGSQWKIV